MVLLALAIAMVYFALQRDSGVTVVAFAVVLLLAILLSIVVSRKG